MNRDRASGALRNLRPLALAAIAVFCLTLPGATPADAQGTTTLRIATLATRSSPWMRVYNAWNNTLRQRTDGRLQLQFFTGGSQGDERDVIRKIRINQLDGAAVTSTGLGQIVRRILVLQAPGVATNYRELDRARDAMRDSFGEAFAGEGYKLLGWGDVGENRIFSNRRSPAPVTSARCGRGCGARTPSSASSSASSGRPACASASRRSCRRSATVR